MHTVVETFEASVGAPPANELASDISQFVKEPSDDEEIIPKVDKVTAAAADDTAAVTEGEAAADPAKSNGMMYASYGLGNSI